MPPAKEWTRIRADSIDEAAGRVIELLEDTSKGNVMYFHGWWGLGASAVLRAVAKRLTMRPSPSPGRRRWEKMIHVDCSVWQSKRALQKAIAQELQLPWSLMALFDQHDEEDDFSGVEQSARGVIQDVSQAILSILASRTFLLIFHNGSNGYIDLLECGVPVITGILNNTVLWTSRSSFRITYLGMDNVSKEDRDKLAGLSDAAIYACPTAYDEDSCVNLLGMVLHQEAEEVARYTGVPQSAGMSTELVKKCIMYQLMLRQQHVDYTQHWDTHAANYWVCSGIIQTSDTTSSTSCHSSSPWEIAQALYNNLILEFLTMDDYSSNPAAFAKAIQRALLRVPSDFVDKSSFFFWTCDAIGNNKVDTTTACCRQKSLEAKMFQHRSASWLRVIHLFKCTFSFASPPFLSCSSLRFLLLDHCKDKHNLSSAPNSTSAGDTDKETGISSGACFQKLWVLDLSYTDWYWLLSVEAQDLMVELRELNVKGVKHWSINHLPLGLLNLVKLQVTTEPITEDQHQSQVWKEDRVAATLFPNLSSCKIVKTIILDGCFELKRIDPHVLPPSLESFSFSSSSNDNDVHVSAKIESISFRGCTQLKSLLLRGLFQRLKQLDVSETCIKTLDLRAMRGNWSLKELFLLGCKELRAILWPKQDVSLEVLHIDTSSTELDHATGVEESSSFSPVEFKWYISVRDRRLLRSLNDTEYTYPLDAPCIEISSPPASVATATTDGSELGGTISKRRPIAVSRAEQRWLMSTKSRRPAADNKKLYADVDSTIQHLQLQATMNGNWMWPCKSEGSTSHYISLQDDKRMQTKPLSSPSLPGSICERASGLHVHDSLSIASITSHSNEARRWYNLEWCRVERCPNIEGVVFTPPSTGSSRIFWYLKTFWASQLARARHIWDWSTRGQLHFEPDGESFNLQVLHLDCCPRLIYVLPLYYGGPSYAYRWLETLEIVCCGDLKDVFRVDDNNQKLLVATIEFEDLKHIHLHELPSLQRICGHRIVAPKLETIKIRGCWSLTRLPAVGLDSTCKPKPKVDCEKEWWDGLQWDGLENGHHPSLYVPTHSCYNKKKLPRGSMLSDMVLCFEVKPSARLQWRVACSNIWGVSQETLDLAREAISYTSRSSRSRSLATCRLHPAFSFISDG
uniref:Disease resistance protein At4g27190-like leucine-rich repeats domain-containing protein n=1 Tax=Oryza nivara TaxID=4536 RepID=A0A0E0J9H8_ORYNI